jgi:hypothetical protein
MNRNTIFSACRSYRYVLWREWDSSNPRYAMFIGLNPSTADEIEDDPTIRRCRNYAKYWGYAAFCMTNLFAFCSTNPSALKSHPLPVGDDNDKWLTQLSAQADVIVAAWGVHGIHRQRDQFVKNLLVGKLSCLAISKHGHPRHPLYLKRALVPVLWEDRER